MLALRAFLRRRSQGPFQLDDGCALLAAVCFIIAGGILLGCSQVLYAADAIAFDPLFVMTNLGFRNLENDVAVVYAVIALGWTAIFAIKFCFLCLFHHLVGRVSRGLVIYYWSVVTVSFLCWALLVCEPFILCPHFGLDSSKLNCLV